MTPASALATVALSAPLKDAVACMGARGIRHVVVADDEALAAPDGERMIDFETRHLGPAWSQHGNNCVPRKTPVHAGWDKEEAGAWFRLVHEAIGAPRSD